MTTRALHPPWRHSASLSLAVVVLALLTSGCGTASPSSHAATFDAAMPSLCARTAPVDRVVVIRSNPLLGDHLHFSFPARVTISNPAKAEAVVKAVCALPRMYGERYCPSDNGVSYRLIFTGESRAHVVDVQATGCLVVRGLGPVRWALTRPGFWNVLGSASGLKSEANGAFTGQ